MPHYQQNNTTICNFYEDPSKHFPWAKNFTHLKIVIKRLVIGRLAWVLNHGASEERKLLAREEIDHFTVVFSVTWPLNGTEAEGDLVLIQTSLLLLCKSSCSYANKFAFKWEKQRGLYQNKVTSSLACIHGHITKHTTVKWPIVLVPDEWTSEVFSSSGF